MAHENKKDGLSIDLWSIYARTAEIIAVIESVRRGYIWPGTDKQGLSATECETVCSALHLANTQGIEVLHDILNAMDRAGGARENEQRTF